MCHEQNIIQSESRASGNLTHPMADKNIIYDTGMWCGSVLLGEEWTHYFVYRQTSTMLGFGDMVLQKSVFNS